ncbi:hypothetical protein LTR37_005144 [Vermiconidia calcicola]|uniref:Uncharacterized protein n=1 Tax=Vermiconidia calcicola TaxID=1690605 RepID=A0ACC3NK91_9PEZI|nr:hypothetical protein LTR37_005144 [Vermiconidia calcicola]
MTYDQLLMPGLPSFPSDMSSTMASEHLNYGGATVFWLYIVAALYFSGLIMHTILTLPPVSASDQDRRARDVKIFSCLACISFGTLSVNMLNVLIQSFSSWTVERGIGGTINIGTIWSWSITSTLFQDFGEAIVANSARYLWAHTALLATLVVCLWIGYEGTVLVPSVSMGKGLRSSRRIATTGASTLGILLLKSNPPH